ncbi:MAG: hypothetical protein AAF950_16075 [Pseudomonadota bacterium]
MEKRHIIILTYCSLSFAFFTCAVDALGSAGNGGSPSEPLPDQAVCNTGVWVLQEDSDWVRQGDKRKYELDGWRLDGSNEYHAEILQSVGMQVLLDGKKTSGNFIGSNSQSVEMILIREYQVERHLLSIQFFKDPNCIENIEVSF